MEGSSRDLGLVQFNLAHMFDAALNSDIGHEGQCRTTGGAADAVMAELRWSGHRVWAFVALCLQKWATVAHTRRSQKQGAGKEEG